MMGSSISIDFLSMKTDGFEEDGAPYIPRVVHKLNFRAGKFANFSKMSNYHLRDLKSPEDIESHITPMFTKFNILHGTQLRKLIDVTGLGDNLDFALTKLDEEITYKCGCGTDLAPCSPNTWYVFFQDPFEEYPWTEFEPYTEGELSKSKVKVDSRYFVNRLLFSIPEKYSRSILAHFDVKQTKLDQYPK